METKANYALIGAFTLAVLAGAFLFVFWFSGGSKQSGRETYRVVFSSSVAGLTRGSNVLFNGLKVGEVNDLSLAPNPSEVYATIEIDSRTPVKTDTRARLEYQGLTGVSSIALSGSTANAPRLVASSAGGVPEIRAERSEFQNIVETLQNTAQKLDALLSKADSLVDSNSSAVSQVVHNVQVFTDALAANSDGVKDFLAGMADLGRTIKPLATRLEGLAGTVDKLVTAVDPERVRSIVANADEFTTALGKNKQTIDTFLADAAKLARDLGNQTGKLDVILTSAQDLTKAVDAKKVGNAVDSLDRFATVLDQNRTNTDNIMRNAAELTAKLNASADKIDGVLASVQGFLGGPGSSGMFSDVGEAAKAMRKLADNLDVRTKEITAGLNRFTGPGLKQYEALAADGRRTLDEINRTVRSLGKNPQQVLFGSKPTVPEYSGR